MAETIDVLEAARRMGITPDAVRARLRRGTLEGYRDNSGNWRIVSSDTMTDTTVSATTDMMPAALRQDTDTTRHYVLSPDLAQLLTKLVKRIEDDHGRLLEDQARLIEERDAARAEAQEARSDANQAKADQARMARDVAVMFDDLKALSDKHAALHADQARLQAELDQARAELAMARRPWWRMWRKS